MLKKYEFILQNLDCANCANKIQTQIAQNPEFSNVVVNFNTLRLSYEAEVENKATIIKIVKAIEPEVEVVEINQKSQENNRKLANQIVRLIVGDRKSVV